MDMAYRKPEHAAEMSYAAAFVAPSSACMSHAVDGSSRSGVAVDSTITSTSPGWMPARSMAMRLARAAISAAPMSASAMRRSRMPVRSKIHSSDVSTSFSMSAFVITRSGRYRPVANDLGDRLSSLHASSPFAGATARAIWPTTPISTHWCAMRMAFFTARGGEPPWQMMVTPFTPSSGAPPYSV
jgi:hypothetical protein